MSKALFLLLLLFVPVLTTACLFGDDEAPVTPTTASATATSEPSPTSSPTAEPTSTPPPRPQANAFPPELQAEANALLEQIVALRGVPLEEPVDMFLLSREQAREFYDTDDDNDQGPAATPGPRPLDTRQELYILLGLIPPLVEGSGEPDIEEQELDNLISIITGFYDHGYRAFYMIETINGGIFGPLARSTIVHELTHALQYQDVDINGIAGERAGNADAMTALLSVMEGEAVYTEIEVLGYSTRSTYRQPVCDTIPGPMRPGTPYAVERELDVWYEDGLCFIQAIVQQDPDAIAGILRDVPSTMEQILHPEKYLEGEVAVPIEPRPLETALGDSWQQLESGVFGEFGLQNILLSGLAEDRERVQAAAAGWGGDAWNLYVAGDARLLHLEIAWDTEAEAPQFIEGLVASLTNRGFTSQTSGETTTLTLENVTWSLTHDGDKVSILVSNDAGALQTAVEAIDSN